MGLPEGLGLVGGDVGLHEGVGTGSGGTAAAPAGGFVPQEGVGQFCVRLRRCVCLLLCFERTC